MFSSKYPASHFLDSVAENFLAIVKKNWSDKTKICLPCFGSLAKSVKGFKFVKFVKFGAFLNWELDMRSSSVAVSSFSSWDPCLSGCLHITSDLKLNSSDKNSSIFPFLFLPKSFFIFLFSNRGTKPWFKMAVATGSDFRKRNFSLPTTDFLHRKYSPNWR